MKKEQGKWNAGTVFQLHGHQMIVTCSYCNEETKTNQWSLNSVGDAVGKMNKAYWQINSKGTKATCPKCVVKFKSINAKKDHAVTDKLPAPLTPKQSREIFAALEENFDAERGIYRNQLSDDKLAAKLNVARVHVITIRDDAFGKLRVDPEIERFRADLEASNKLMNEALDSLRKQYHTLYDEFHNRLRKLGG